MAIQKRNYILQAKVMLESSMEYDQTLAHIRSALEEAARRASCKIIKVKLVREPRPKKL